MSKQIISIEVERVQDEFADTSYLDQDEFEDRKADFERGDFDFIGIQAKAKILLSDQSPVQIIRSGGLWGIESDSDEDYLESIEQEEREALYAELRNIGFTQKTIEQAA